MSAATAIGPGWVVLNIGKRKGPVVLARVTRRGPTTVVEIRNLETVSENNRSRHEHPQVTAQRARDQVAYVAAALREWSTRCPFPPPYAVMLVRQSAGSLDPFDNLPGSLKHIADGVARWAAVDDRDPRVIRFTASQERTPRGTRGVKIEFGPAEGAVADMPRPAVARPVSRDLGAPSVAQGSQRPERPLAEKSR